MHLQESGEMYLETILILSKEMRNVRAVDISEYMGFSKPSVSRAVGLLKKGGMLTVDSDGYIKLTEQGMSCAKKIYERHKLLTKILVHIGVDEHTADADACKIEHVISDVSFEKLKEYAVNTGINSASND